MFIFNELAERFITVGLMLSSRSLCNCFWEYGEDKAADHPLVTD